MIYFIHGDEPSGFIKDGEFLDQLNDCLLLRKVCASWSYALSYLLEDFNNINPLTSWYFV